MKVEEPEITVIESEDEDEDVLVDDFDGQCCRTYPYNHSKIQRWRENRNKKEKEKKEKEQSSKQLANVQKPPTSNPEKAINSNWQNNPITTAAGKYSPFMIYFFLSLSLKVVKILKSPLSLGIIVHFAHVPIFYAYMK